MHTFAQKSKSNRQAVAHASVPPVREQSQGRDINTILRPKSMIDNQAVTQLMQADPQLHKDSTHSNHTTRFGHDFGRISIHSLESVSIQPKLMLNEPRDIYEQEADRVAEKVMRMEIPSLSLKYAGCGKNNEQKANMKPVSGVSDLSIPVDYISSIGAGQPLDETTRNYFEARFKTDLSHVRVHTNSKAAKTAQQLNSHAFTWAYDIVFGPGLYQPEAPEGKRLLAHELTHVVQQGRALKSRSLLASHQSSRPDVSSLTFSPEYGGPHSLIQRSRIKRGFSSVELREASGQTGGDSLEILQVLMTADGLGKEIAKAAEKWNVTPLAIVGVIAWEALVRPRHVTARSSGIGKMHHREYWPPFGEGEPLSKQLEDIGYLPKRTMEERRKALLDPIISIGYIGAALNAFSVIAEKYGYSIWNGLSIRSNLGVLGYAYNSKKLDTWNEHLKNKKGRSLEGGEMGIWMENNVELLREIYPDRTWKEIEPSHMDKEIGNVNLSLVTKEW